MMPEFALRYPLRLDGRGLATSTSDPTSIWTDRVRVLLSTYAGERAGRPGYGTDAEASMFLGVEQATETAERAVRQAITRYLPELDDVAVRAYPSDESSIGVEVVFTPPNARETSISTNLDVVLLGLSR